MNIPVFLTNETGKPLASFDKGRSLIILIILIISGFFGNYFSLPLFFGADFLFGSIAVLLVLYFFGLSWGMLAAVIAHSYTYFLWGHPYGFINFVSEALFVGIFITKGRRNLLALVGLFWLIIGMPLVWIEHGVIMHMDAISTAFIILKQAINGMFNALLVSLTICYLLPLFRLPYLPLPFQKITLRESFYNLLVMMVLVPALLLTGLQIKDQKKQLETELMIQLQSISANVHSHMLAWYQSHLKAVEQLAVVAGQTSMKPSATLQQVTGILHDSFPNFRTMHVENAEGYSIAFNPPLNENGNPNLGLDFSGSSWFQGVKAKQQPLVSEVFVGRLAVFAPIVNLCVPIIREKRWLGCATGTLDLKSIREMLRPYLSDKIVRLTLTDSQNRIIISTDSKQAPLQPWNLKKTGISEPISATMFFWHPGDKELPSMTRWKQSFYVQETLFRQDFPWTLIAEASVAPLQSTLYIIYVKNLSIIAVLTALALLLSQIFSGGLTQPLTKLAEATADLPEKLESTQDIKWPVVFTQEMDLLINNFKSMAQTLKVTFNKLKLQSDELSQANRNLSLKIRERQIAEEKIQASLLEKETMLKEIHHRVKNNLQVISSLLDMQSSYLEDEKAKEALQASMARVKTMASIHSQLYQAHDLVHIDFRIFIQDLIGNISQSYGRPESSVNIQVDAHEVSLDIDNSIPCGLILNELVANALQHAFPEGRGGRINITMRLANNQIMLRVSDNGIGFPESVDMKNLKSLGMELVNILVRQMNGKINMQVDGGTTWTITFPIKNEREWRNG